MVTDRMNERRRDRIVIGVALALITLLAWAYMLRLAAGMPANAHATMEMMAMPAPLGWDWHALGLAVLMWCVMMAAMMLPSTSPMVLTFARVYQRRQGLGGPIVPTAVFVAGYLAIWSGFGVLSAFAQTALHQAALIATPMDGFGRQTSAALLIVAGTLQWSSLKTACLEKCRTPLGFLLAEWREGRAGAFMMGLRHGAFCVGCCWAVMLLMFVGGAMNLLWMAALTVFVLLEKIVPRGQAFSRLSGVALVASGVWMLI